MIRLLPLLLPALLGPRPVLALPGNVTVNVTANGCWEVAPKPVARQPGVAPQPQVAHPRVLVSPRPRVSRSEVAVPARPPDRPPALSRARPAAPAAPDSARRKVVILDAGHGGRDPGRDGPDGIREKDLTLALVRRLAAELKDRGYEVHLTRDADTLISLADRPRRANDWKRGRPQAVFVSIHANGGVKQARGFETFFLSDARTADERRVAEMENAAEDYEVRRVAAPTVDRILESLRNDYYVRASDDLAELIQRRLAAVHPGPDRGVKRAGFRVLVGAIMPAVLVETGFITNRREERLLASAAFQRKLTGALAGAIDTFFTRHAWAAGAEE